MAANSSKDVSVTGPSSWDTSTVAGLREILAEDRATNPGTLMIPTNLALATHRLSHWGADPARTRVTRQSVRAVCRALRSLQRNVLGVELEDGTTVGRRVRFMHSHGVVIGAGAEIGDDVTIYHNVTIGMRWHGDDWPEEYREPARIGCNVILATGVTLVGSIRVGDDAKIGPHAVVTFNVPQNASVVAPPSRVLRLRD